MENILPESEEIIERSITDKIVIDGYDIPVLGVLESCLEQTDTKDSYIYVKVDQSSQDLDYVGYHIPHTYTVTIGVRMSQADSFKGKDFVMVCRQVRSYINSFLGDGCESLSTDNFDCDSCMLESTSTEFEGGEDPTNVKTYNLKIVGRIKI